MKKMYESTYGLWQVTTEGDVEGRSTRNLGTFEGHVDEIALHLADQCYYSLQFKLMEPIEKFVPKKKSVSVMFDIGTGTWDMGRRLTEKMRAFFADRPVQIEDSNYFSSFTITTEQNARAEDRRKALAKLTNYEKELLGIKE